MHMEHMSAGDEWGVIVGEYRGWRVGCQVALGSLHTLRTKPIQNIQMQVQLKYGGTYLQSATPVRRYFSTWVLRPRSRLKECGAVVGRISWHCRRDRGRIGGMCSPWRWDSSTSGPAFFLAGCRSEYAVPGTPRTVVAVQVSTRYVVPMYWSLWRLEPCLHIGV